MEVNSPALNAKKQKLGEQCKFDEGGDRIGNLPEGILLHIVSFLSTKDVVKTIILSKTWQYLWMLVPNVNLKFQDEDRDEGKRKLFMNSVERVLVLCDPPNIQKFSLSCNVSLDASRINAWIFAAVRSKVQELDLCLTFDYESCLLPCSLFTCESLEVLVLDMVVYLMLPSVICFSSLKMMTLKHVLFYDDNSLAQLLSGCPVLEKLTLDKCDWENVKSVCISAPMLRSLAIFECLHDGSNCKIVIDGTSLKSSDYGGGLKNDYCLCNSSSLVDACINVYKRRYTKEQGRQREVAERTHKLPRGLHNARKLILSYEIFEWSVNFACGALMKLLQNLPSLNTMKCEEEISLTPYCVKDDWILDPVPQCFSENLKTIEICTFYGTQKELDVMKSLLKTATALERIYLDFFGGLKEKYEYIKPLGMLPSESLSAYTYRNAYTHT